MHSPKTKPADPSVQEAVRSLVQQRGLGHVGRVLRFADATVSRLAAGFPVSEGTALLAATRLAQLGPEAAEVASARGAHTPQEASCG